MRRKRNEQRGQKSRSRETGSRRRQEESAAITLCKSGDKGMDADSIKRARSDNGSYPGGLDRHIQRILRVI
jgi:hypothetical protein